jgi:Cupin domain
VSDTDVTSRLVSPVSTLNNLWQSESLPTRVLVESTHTEAFDLLPPSGGVKVMTASLPPDSEWMDDPAKYAEALRASGIPDAGRESDKAHGFHETDTVDVITMLSGEIYAVLETTEVLLRPGDTLVQRGTKHAWSNRSDAPAVFVLTMISAERTDL